MNNIITTGWKNKSGTKNRQCKCGSWKIHWMNYSGQKWPEKCSVQGCSNAAEVGAHVYNNEVAGEQIIPACKACNQRTDSFSLKSGTTLVSANKQKTCE